MTRPLRLEFPGALYHVTSRGDRKAAIYLDDTDRAVWMQILADVCSHFDFAVYSVCQMTNHYHLLIETPDGRLSQGMRQLNGIYSQYFNRRHGLVGHVFQGRYQAILVQRETYLMELARYIVLNPVRAHIVALPEDWPWSSYRLTIGTAPPPTWLDTSWVRDKLCLDHQDAITAYRAFVHAGIGGNSPLTLAHHELLLGDEAFIARFQIARPASSTGISRSHRSTQAWQLQAYQEHFNDRDEAIARAHATSAYSITEIARHFNVSQKTAARAIKRWHGLL